MGKASKKKKIESATQRDACTCDKTAEEVKKYTRGNIDLRGLLPNLASDFNYYIRAIC